jgi:hypothetical protein
MPPLLEPSLKDIVGFRSDLGQADIPAHMIVEIGGSINFGAHRPSGGGYEECPQQAPRSVAPVECVYFCRQNIGNHYVHFTHSFSAPARASGQVLSGLRATRADMQTARAVMQ